jgi:hypothetical protein
MPYTVTELWAEAEPAMALSTARASSDFFIDNLQEFLEKHYCFDLRRSTGRSTAVPFLFFETRSWKAFQQITAARAKQILAVGSKYVVTLRVRNTIFLYWQIG